MHFIAVLYNRFTVNTSSTGVEIYDAGRRCKSTTVDRHHAISSDGFNQSAWWEFKVVADKAGDERICLGAAIARTINDSNFETSLQM